MHLRLFILIIIITVASSCKLAKRYTFGKGEVVAEVGNAYLYKEDLDKIVPRGLEKADSISLAKQFIDSWALKQLMLQKAEEMLPKDDKDVERELEEYRMQLLIFRFENKYVEEKLDTLIKDQEMLQYYNEHPDSFIAKNGIIKTRLIKMHNSSPNLQIVRKLAQSKDEGNMEELEDLAYNSAYKYITYNDDWVDLQLVSKDMGIDLSQLQELIAKKNIIELKDSVYTNILHVVEYKKTGEQTPFEYNTERIKDIILTKRKQDVLNNLQKDIFKSALENNKLKIKNDDNEEASS